MKRSFVKAFKISSFVATAMLLSTSITSTAQAGDCAAATIDAIQVQDAYVLVNMLGNNGSPVWRLVGYYSNAGVSIPATTAKLAVMTAAQMEGKKVVMRYPDPYDCSATEYATSSTAVRVSTD